MGGEQSALKENQAYGQFRLGEEEGSKVAIIEKVTEKTPQLKAELQFDLERRQKIASKNIVRLRGYSLLEEDHALVVSLKYDYFSQTLQHYHQRRAKRGFPLTQQQLQSILNNVSKAIRDLYFMGIRHGCVNMDTVLHHKGVPILTDVSSTAYLMSYEWLLKGNYQQALSPKLMSMFNQGVLKHIVANNLEARDDLFSLGLLVLALATDKTLGEFYEYTIPENKKVKVELKQDRIMDMLYLLSKKYSQELEQQVRKMLGPDWMPKNTKRTKEDTATNSTIRNPNTRSHQAKKDSTVSIKSEEVEIMKTYSSTNRGKSSRKKRPGAPPPSSDSKQSTQSMSIELKGTQSMAQTYKSFDLSYLAGKWK